MHVKCTRGSVYWDELADRCGEISRAAGFRGAARFRGNTVACEGTAHISGNLDIPRMVHRCSAGNAYLVTDLCCKKDKCPGIA